MANIVITSYFTLGGSPAIGISPLPTVNVWDIAEGSETLVVSADVMSEVGDGLYKYVFTSYDSTKNYVALSDAGIAFPPNERYSIGTPEGESSLDATDLTAIADAVAPAVWEESASTHLGTDTMGLLQNTTAANTSQIQIDVNTAISLVTTLIKYQTNRTKIDKIAKTLTIYDDDGTTIIQVFDLKDGLGDPSILEVCERLPQ